MEAKLKVITIGDYSISILKNYFKDNENIEFLKLALDKSIENLNTNFSKRDIVFLRTNTENLEKLLEVGKALKEKEIITLTILEEKIVMENKEVLEETVNAIFPATKKDDIDNLLLELIKMIYNIIFERCYINLDVEDVRSMLRDSGITIFGRLNMNNTISEEDIIKNISYPFYPKNLKDSKKLLIFLDTLEGFVLTEGELITDTLKNESGKTIEDVLFSIRMANRLKNRIECSFISGLFKER
jgi:putative cell division protein ftsZ